MHDLETLIEKAKAVQLQAYAPYSNFSVGACLETDKHNLYVGCNVENASYGLAVCAESNAIAAMIAGGEKRIIRMVVTVQGPGVSACCGACRQKLYEFADPSI